MAAWVVPKYWLHPEIKILIQVMLDKHGGTLPNAISLFFIPVSMPVLLQDVPEQEQLDRPREGSHRRGSLPM